MYMGAQRYEIIYLFFQLRSWGGGGGGKRDPGNEVANE